ncbi:phage portal protein [Actinomyces faecalis]|uniref:phage portal protein n=1 Tax=Actinomyces faecalis TaxID=2722820 RepID=UPI0024681107|nr:phage portal protein [Actinomyces faecalis]
MTSFVFREALLTHLLLWGNAYLQVLRNGLSEVIGLYPLMPDRMSVGRDDAERLYDEYHTTSDESHSEWRHIRLAPPMCCKSLGLASTVESATRRLR